tara:strand:+ start:2881 stop:3051 length:171 start_codon:yes stop_codon:yes gene_type:complete
MNCWFCGEDMHWLSEHDFEDIPIDGEGSLVELECSHCDAFAHYYSSHPYEVEEVKP